MIINIYKVIKFVLLHLTFSQSLQVQPGNLALSSFFLLGEDLKAYLISFVFPLAGLFLNDCIIKFFLYYNEYVYTSTK